MILNIKTWKLKNKILVICLLISIVPIIVLGITNYYLSEKAIFDQIKEKLGAQVGQYKNSITTSMKDVQAEIEFQKNNGKNIITQQANMLIQLIKSSKNDNGEKLIDIISKFGVGKTGYVFILDYSGKYILSNKRLRDGEDISNSKDDTGRLFIKDIVNKGLKLSENGLDYDNYFWKNTGEKNAREKISAIIHVPARKWIIGVSAYYDDLVDINIVEKKLSEFKANLLNELVGKSGYMYIMNSKGDLIMHPKQEGDNIYQYDFVKKMCADKNKGVIQYDWEGKQKIAAYDYYQPNDWIIASGSYLSDFTGTLLIIQISIIVMVLISIIIVVIVILLFTNSINKTLEAAITDLNNGSSQIITASNQLSSSSQEIANGATEQASSIEETTSSMEELASMVKQNVQNANEASTLADKTAGASQTGYVQMEKMLESMNDINKASAQIQKIIKVIDDIAFQTNILALNAAVEAARAGEAGMGFAVVADEVKNLANKSAEAAKETASMIEDSIKKTGGGLDIATKLAEVFKDILTNAQKVSEMAKEVETASRQQDAGINQVNKAIVQFDEVVQSNASTAEETASSAEELLAQVETLNGIVRQLVLMVAGKEKKIEQYQKDQVEYKTDRTNKLQQNTLEKKQVLHPRDIKKKEIDPEKIIPFEEDEEFKQVH